MAGSAPLIKHATPKHPREPAAATSVNPPNPPNCAEWVEPTGSAEVGAPHHARAGPRTGSVKTIERLSAEDLPDEGFEVRVLRPKRRPRAG